MVFAAKMRPTSVVLIAALGLIWPVIGPGTALAQQAQQDDLPPRQQAPAQVMTLDRMNDLVIAVDPDAQRSPAGNMWQLRVEDVPLTIITDPGHDRMRVIAGIAPADELEPALLFRLMQANFDTALDARYAIAQDVLWATFIHPLSPLTREQFLSGIGQTVNLARTFGSTFSSGALSFGGGDSRGLLERQLIDELLKKGRDI